MKDAARQLEAWFGRVQRPLPWRKTSDPYRIWISEVMLQQTQVATVLDYYRRFLESFPTLTDLARAKEMEVMRLWSGLGYYSRARNLQKGAQYLEKEHSGKFPKTRDELLEVPGIGPYTAGAILSIAFDLKEPLVDGNVIRVFSRYFGYRECVDIPKHQRFFWEKARDWVLHAHSPRIFNQALMELGATVCTKAAPLCETCPLQKNCVALAKGLVDELPVRKKRTATKELHWTMWVYEKGGKILLRKNEQGAWWEGLWDLPREEEVRNLSSTAERLPRQIHTVTHHKITVNPIYMKGKAPKKKGEEIWINREEALRWPLSSLSRKVLSSLSS